jgi:hypothetical protein
MVKSAKRNEAEALLHGYLVAKKTLDDAKKKAKISDLELSADAAKAALVHSMLKAKLDQVNGPGCHATLVKSYFKPQFIGTDEDIPDDAPRAITPLRTIIRKKFGPFAKGSKSTRLWNRITKRVVDTSAVEEVIAEGILSVDDVSPSFYEVERAPYVRIFED